MLVSVQSWTATPLWSPAASAPWLTGEIRGTRKTTTGIASLEVNSPDSPQRNLRQGAGHGEEMHTGRDAWKLHYSSKIDICSTTKQLFSVSDELLGKAKTTSLPSNIPIADLPQRFCDFFVTKIKQIREDLDSCPHDPPSFFKFDGPQLSMFEPVTEELICRLISQSPTKSCTFDPIPTTLSSVCMT